MFTISLDFVILYRKGQNVCCSCRSSAAILRLCFKAKAVADVPWFFVVFAKCIVSQFLLVLVAKKGVLFFGKSKMAAACCSSGGGMALSNESKKYQSHYFKMKKGSNTK